jgi:hypothetical protein
MARSVEFGRQCRTTDDVRVDATTAQTVFEVANRLLASADHHVVDLEQTRVRAIGAELMCKPSSSMRS